MLSAYAAVACVVFDCVGGGDVKTEAGQYTIVMPEACEPDTAYVHAFSGGFPELAQEGYWCAMIRIEYTEMMRMMSEPENGYLNGVPMRYAVSPQGTEIVYYPANDRAREISVRYCPAMKEI